MDQINIFSMPSERCRSGGMARNSLKPGGGDHRSVSDLCSLNDHGRDDWSSRVDDAAGVLIGQYLGTCRD